MLCDFHRGSTLSLLVALSALSLAQSPYFLTPESFLTTSRTVSITLRTGQGSQTHTELWDEHPTRWVFVKTGRVQENRDSLGEWLDSSGNFVPKIPAPGPVMIGIDFLPVIEVTTIERLNKSLSKPLLMAQGSIKIRHYRSAITLLRTDWPGEDSPDSTIATTETSLASSIHPLMDPTVFQLGGDMAFEAVVHGQEIDDAKIYAKNLTTGATTIMETTGGGMCRFSPDSAGSYQLVFQFARQLSSDPEASVELFTTTLTFKLQSPKEAKS